jgi:hypothetical protein
MPMRLLAAVAVLVSAAVHLYLYFDVFSSEPVVGPAFLLNAFGGTAIAVLLVVWRHWLPPLLSIGFGVSTLTAFVIATTVGLFGVHEHWTGWAVWTAAAAEVVAVAAGAAVLIGERAPASRVEAQHHEPVRGANLH